MSTPSNTTIELPGGHVSFYGDGATYIEDSYTSSRFKRGRRAQVMFHDAENPGANGERGIVRFGHGQKFVELQEYNNPGLEADKKVVCANGSAAIRAALALDPQMINRGRLARAEDAATLLRERVAEFERQLEKARKKLAEHEREIALLEIEIDQNTDPK